GKNVQGFLNYSTVIDLFDQEQMKNLEERKNLKQKDYFNLFNPNFADGHSQGQNKSKNQILRLIPITYS
ncbi:MAG TPA: hypothetical protein DCF44_02660, partial [Chitinophagaceae bacterium]|nr:hypothetical protein [Chitinophagaceae bacterium]